MVADHVDRVLEQWGAQRPDLDVSPMAVIGRLSRLSRLIGAELGRTFSARGLDAASFDVLATLRRSGPLHRLTPADLMRASMVTSGAITQRLDRLQARGLVTRIPSELDGRVVHVALTDDGRALIDQALPDHVDTENRLLAPLTRTQRDALADTLRSLLESLGDTTDGPRTPAGRSRNPKPSTETPQFRTATRMKMSHQTRSVDPAGATISYVQRRSKAQNMASVPCRCGQSCTCELSPSAGTPGNSGRASSCSAPVPRTTAATTPTVSARCGEQAR